VGRLIKHIKITCACRVLSGEANWKRQCKRYVRAYDMLLHLTLEQAAKWLKVSGFCYGCDEFLAFKRARIPY
jgi:hypothetical protein